MRMMSFFLVLVLFASSSLAGQLIDNMIYVSSEEHHLWRFDHDDDYREWVNEHEIGNMWAPTWHAAELHCEHRFNTNMSISEPDDFNILSSVFEPWERFYVGIREKVWLEPNADGSDWIRVSGRECPSNSSDEVNGHRLCYGKDKWWPQEPNNAWHSEHCAEALFNGTEWLLNDILCYKVRYTRIAGFFCDKPVDYKPDNYSDLVLGHDNDAYEKRPRDSWNFHLISFGDFAIFFKDLIILIVIFVSTLICYFVKRKNNHYQKSVGSSNESYSDVDLEDSVDGSVGSHSQLDSTQQDLTYIEVIVQ